MLEKIRTMPDLIDSSPEHKNALEKGHEHFFLWTRNVVDEFKEISNEEIKSTLRERSFPFAVCFENVIHDLNVSTIIRNANAFNAKEVFYIGNKRFDRRGCVGTYNYTDVKWLSTIKELESLKEKYTFIGIDNVPGSVSMDNFEFENDTLFIFGEESVGLTSVAKSMCEKLIHITQYGSVRSLNVGTASGIVMHDFVRKYNKR